jgi:hypothetical protein
MDTTAIQRALAALGYALLFEGVVGAKPALRSRRSRRKPGL